MQLRSKQFSAPIVEKAGSMEEKSRQLKTLAAMELSDVNLLQKQLEYQQKFVLLVEKNLQDIVKNITNVSHQLIDINKTKGDFLVFSLQNTKDTFFKAVSKIISRSN